MPRALLGAESVALVATAQENRLDGCVECGCRSSTVVPGGRKQLWWMTFGLVEPGKGVEWTRSGPQGFSYCGWGAFESVEKEFKRTKGIPYAIVEIEASLEQVDNTGAGMAVSGSVRKLSGFGRRAQPKYDSEPFEQTRRFAPSMQSVITVFAADEKERAEFQVHEILVSLEGFLLGDEEAAYGNIVLESDMPGAAILLNGELAGRVREAQSFDIENLPTGELAVGVRDYSGRIQTQTVSVNAGETTRLRIDLLSGLEDRAGDEYLVLSNNPQGFEERWRERDGAIEVMIPSGVFLMGSESRLSEEDERPQHEVFLSSFWIDKTEVTWRQYAMFAADSGRALPPEPLWGRQEHYALSSTNWADADQYCRWVGARLPSEAEWEKAARGTDGRDYPWGADWDPNRCNSISGGMHRPEDVGSFPGCVSPYGVLDMAGSHWQWVNDFYSADYYKNAPAEDPKGPESGPLRVKRGGYWMGHPSQIRVTRRGKSSPDWRNTPHSFRCAHDYEGEGS